MLDAGALLIGLREGLEALLVLGILLGMLRRLGHAEQGRRVWLGAVLGVVASVAAGLLVEAAFQAWFEDTGAALFEVVVALVAVGILTYMVLWMQRHTTQLLGVVKERVALATATGRWGLLAALAFVTVFREGIEVVLFFAARSADVPWSALLVSGAVGLLLSAVVAYAVFRLTVQVSLRGFFGVTGLLLVFVAAGLLVHVGHAAADLGWIPHGEPLWDTSGALPDDGHWLGGPLHALVGYEDQPTMFQLLLYVGYVVGVGGWYLGTLLQPERRARRARSAAVATLLVLFAGAAFAAALAPGQQHAAHDDATLHHAKTDHAVLLADALAALDRQDGRIGVLVRNHGEPVEYNATTYESFKRFIDELWPYMGLPPELLLVDQGTYFIDEEHPWSDQVHAERRLVDAWVRPWGLPALPVTDPSGLSPYHDFFEGTYYLAPGGPGLGEGDLYEVFALGAYRTWLKMDNHSPAYFDVEEAFAWLDEHARRHFGDRVVLAYAYSVDPRMRADRSVEAAARQLAEADVDLVIDAYMSSVHSDAMQCMMAAHTLHALHAAGYDGPIVPLAGMAGHHPSWARAVAEHVAAEAALRAPGTVLSVHLAQHGGDPASQNACGDGPDQYHENARIQFGLAEQAIQALVPGVAVRHVYGQGADGAEDGVLSPLEALALDEADGVDEAVVVPYEFWGNAMDHLVYLRESLGFEPEQSPYYDAAYETRFTRNGVAVHVTRADYGMDLEAEALLAVIADTVAAEWGA